MDDGRHVHTLTPRWIREAPPVDARCGGEMRIVAFILHRQVVDQSLRHLERSAECRERAPPAEFHGPGRLLITASGLVRGRRLPIPLRRRGASERVDGGPPNPARGNSAPMRPGSRSEPEPVTRGTLLSVKKVLTVPLMRETWHGSGPDAIDRDLAPDGTAAGNAAPVPCAIDSGH